MKGIALINTLGLGLGEPALRSMGGNFMGDVASDRVKNLLGDLVSVNKRA